MYNFSRKKSMMKQPNSLEKRYKAFYEIDKTLEN